MSGGRVSRIQRKAWVNRYPSNWNTLSEQVKQADGMRCVKCGHRGSKDNPLQTDHTIPLSRGGSNARINLRCLCENCNRKRRRGK